MEEITMNGAEKMPSPCKTCRLVSSSYGCDNKNCPRWSAWWKDQWERTRALFRAAMDVPVKKNPYAFQYDTPDQVRRYLSEDPCEKCKIPKDLCSTPCRSKKTWEDARGDWQ